MAIQEVKEKDGYKQSAFSTANKVKRFIWIISWSLLCRWTPRPLHRWRVLILRAFGARMGKANYVYPDCKIWAPWLLETGEVVTIGPNVEIYNPGGVELGHHVILSQYAYLCGATHDYNSADFTYLKKRITLAPYSWICAKAIVLPGVVCGEGSVLGAASVTSKDLDPWVVYAGNPAQRVKERKNFTLL